MVNSDALNVNVTFASPSLDSGVNSDVAVMVLPSASTNALPVFLFINVPERVYL